MNRCYLQFWEESERNWGVRPDGCSIHISVKEHHIYTNTVYEIRDVSNIPDEYDRIVGSMIECFVSDDIYNQLLSEKSLRLMEYEMNNLINFEDIILKKCL